MTADWSPLWLSLRVALMGSVLALVVAPWPAWWLARRNWPAVTLLARFLASVPAVIIAALAVPAFTWPHRHRYLAFQCATAERETASDRGAHPTGDVSLRSGAAAQCRAQTTRRTGRRRRLLRHPGSQRRSDPGARLAGSPRTAPDPRRRVNPVT